MGMKQIKYCSRCKAEITNKEFPHSKVSVLQILKIFGFGSYDYTTHECELCATCTKEFDKFIRKDDTK